MNAPLAIALVNMPFGLLMAPSIAFAQLRGLLSNRFSARVEARECHASFDAAEFLGQELYSHVHSSQGYLTHFGEWFFSNAAFRMGHDNTLDYLERYYFEASEECKIIHEKAVLLRPRATAFLDSVIDKYNLLQADIVGLTLLFFQTTSSLALARRIKERKGKPIVVLGGPACEGKIGQAILKCAPWVDYVFSGPALSSFPLFVERMLVGDVAGCEFIDGVFSASNENLWPGKTESIKHSSIGMWGEETDINNWVPLDYEPFLQQCRQYMRADNIKPMLLFETSRGCWWAQKHPCAFCGLNRSGCAYQAMRPDEAVAYIRSLARYARKASCFVAVDTAMPPDYPKKVFAKLGLSDGMRFVYEVRPELTSEELQVLESAGVVCLQPGIESLSTRTLDLMGKGTRAFENLIFLKQCAGRSMTIQWNLLLFTPGEPQETYERYLSLIPSLYHLPPPTAAYPIMFVRNSRYLLSPDRYELELVPQEFYRYIYPFEDDAIYRMAFFFVNKKLNGQFADEWLEKTNAAITKWRMRWQGSDGLLPAALRHLRDGSGIYDSRSGRAVVHRFDAFVLDILHDLGTPLNINLLGSRHRGCHVDQIKRILQMLCARDLVFEEDGTFLSLVT